MARLGARGLAVAVGMPVAFVLVASLLAAVGGSSATASEPTPSPSATEQAPAAAAAPAQEAFFGVRRTLVRVPNPLTVSYRQKTTDDVVFITIDDGVFKDREALRLVQQWKLPITAFLSTWTIKDRAPYFRAITQWGSIQNHSMTHANLLDSASHLQHEVCGAQRDITKDFGVQPWMLRPPYGAGPNNMFTQVTAERCGIARIVMWDAVVDKGKLSVPGGTLRIGDIVLLHFTNDLARDLRVAAKAMHRAGLRPASLAQYIPDTNGKTP